MLRFSIIHQFSGAVMLGVEPKHFIKMNIARKERKGGRDLGFELREPKWGTKLDFVKFSVS